MMEHRVDNDLQYICASICYLQTCIDETYSRNAWPVPLLRGHAQPLSTSGLRLTSGYLLQLFLRHQLLLKIQIFRKSDSFSFDDKKGREILWSYLGVFTFMSLFMYFFVDLQYLVDMCFILQYLFCGIGWHEPLYGQIYFMISLLSVESYVSLSFC